MGSLQSTFQPSPLPGLNVLICTLTVSQARMKTASLPSQMNPLPANEKSHPRPAEIHLPFSQPVTAEQETAADATAGRQRREKTLQPLPILSHRNFLTGYLPAAHLGRSPQHCFESFYREQGDEKSSQSAGDQAVEKHHP